MGIFNFLRSLIVILQISTDVRSGSLHHSVGEYMQVVIFTEKNQKYYSEKDNYSTVYAVHEISTLDIVEEVEKAVCARDSLAIIVEPSNSSSFIDFMKMICNCMNCTRRSVPHWSPYIFLIWPNPVSSLQDFEDEITNTYINNCSQSGNGFLLNNEVYVIIGQDTFTAYDLYTLKNMTVFRQIKNRNHNLTFEVFQGRVKRRRDLMGAKLRALGVVSSTVHSLMFKEENGELTLVSGYNCDYFKAMIKSLNARAVGVRGNSTTRLGPNGSITGIGKQLLDGEADVSIMHSEYLTYRAKHLSFLQPHYESPITAFFQQPVATSIRDIYVRSIKIELRLAIIFTWILLMASLVAISLGLKYTNSLKNRVDPIPDLQISNALQWGLVALCQQGSPIQPVHTSMKAGFIVSVAFGVVICIAFSASVVSQLSVPVVPIKSFQDLLNNDFQIHIDNITQSAMEYTVNAEKNGVLKPMPMEERVVTIPTAAELIQQGKFAYLSIEDELYLSLVNSSNKFRCEILASVTVTAAKSIGLPVLSGMYVTKDSPYTEVLKYSQLEMREFGIHHRLHEDYVRRSSPRCQAVRKPEPPELGLNDTLTAFMILLIFAAISLTILCCEIGCAHLIT